MTGARINSEKEYLDLKGSDGGPDKQWKNKEIHNLYTSPHITEDEMRQKGAQCSAYGIDAKHLEDLSGNLKGRYYFEDGTSTLKRNTVQLSGTM